MPPVVCHQGTSAILPKASTVPVATATVSSSTPAMMTWIVVATNGLPVAFESWLLAPAWTASSPPAMTDMGTNRTSMTRPPLLREREGGMCRSAQQSVFWQNITAETHMSARTARAMAGARYGHPHGSLAAPARPRMGALDERAMAAQRGGGELGEGPDPGGMTQVLVGQDPERRLHRGDGAVHASEVGRRIAKITRKGRKPEAALRSLPQGQKRVGAQRDLAAAQLRVHPPRDRCAGETVIGADPLVTRKVIGPTVLRQIVRTSVDGERDLRDVASDQRFGRLVGGTDRHVSIALAQVEQEVRERKLDLKSWVEDAKRSQNFG